jgi:predicted MFS family arabinose efflux permease
MSVLSFLESFASVLLQRAAFFYTKDRLGFSDEANLWLALVAGLVYIPGAMLSHGLSRRIGERRLLLGVVLVQIALNGVLGVWPRPVVVFACLGLLGVVLGLKWPVIESYTSAGLMPSDSAKAIGRFNFAWASAIPLALLVAGPLIAWNDWAMFALAGALNVVSVLVICRLEARPAHLPQDHPERLGGQRLWRLRHLLRSARWLMLASYSGLWVLSALMPGVFGDLGFRARSATAMWGLADVVRLSAFVVLGVWTGWHERRWPLLRVMVVMPAGFALMLSGRGLAVVLVGEALFGWGAGEVYYAALYYAMVAENASVKAGAGHESLIGLGFALGPAAGLIGAALAPLLHDKEIGILLVVGLLFVVCSVGASRALLRAKAPAGGR